MPKHDEVPKVGSPEPGENVIRVCVMGVNYGDYIRGELLDVPESYVEKATRRYFPEGSKNLTILDQALLPASDPRAQKLLIDLKSIPRDTKAHEAQKARREALRAQEGMRVEAHHRLDEEEAQRKGYLTPAQVKDAIAEAVKEALAAAAKK